LSTGIDPATGDLSLRAGLVFRGFNFQTSADVAKRSVGIRLTYGRALLPFPDELSQTFNAANGGLMSMAGNIGAAPDNPLAWYRLHKDDAAAIGKAVDSVKKIAAQKGSSDRFGAGLRLNYHAESGFTIYGGVGLWF
jgi:hypothetical protein